MNTFHLQIVTPDGLIFDGTAQKIVLRTTEGDIGILKGHADYVSAVSTGEAKIVLENGEQKIAACSGGLLSVREGKVRLVAVTFEWAQDIDIERAKKAYEKNAAIKSSSDYEEKAAEIKLRKAITRIHVGEKYRMQ